VKILLIHSFATGTYALYFWLLHSTTPTDAIAPLFINVAGVVRLVFYHCMNTLITKKVNGYFANPNYSPEVSRHKSKIVSAKTTFFWALMLTYVALVSWRVIRMLSGEASVEIPEWMVITGVTFGGMASVLYTTLFWHFRTPIFRMDQLIVSVLLMLQVAFISTSWTWIIFVVGETLIASNVVRSIYKYDLHYDRSLKNISILVKQNLNEIKDITKQGVQTVKTGRG
jgi:uncharacterized membrane protein YhdT